MTIECDETRPGRVCLLGPTTTIPTHPAPEIPQMNTRIGKAVSLLVLCLVVPMGIARAQAKGVTCTDGTTSASVGKGACSGHGGVKAKAATKTTTTQAGKTKSATKSATKTRTSTKMEGGETKAAKPAAKTTAKPDAKVASKPAAPAAKTSVMASAADKDPKNATASCKDGTYSHAATHTGACSGHGGVAKFLKP
jgi:hypothetical protein